MGNSLQVRSAQQGTVKLLSGYRMTGNLEIERTSAA